MGEKAHIQYYIRKPASYQLNNQYIDRKNLTVFAILLIINARISQHSLEFCLGIMRRGSVLEFQGAGER